MRSLSGAFNSDSEKKGSSLIAKSVEPEETVPRKILEDDYEFIREYAFRMKLKMLEATDKIYKKIRDEIEKKSTSIINIDVDEIDVTNQKSIRLSTEFNDYLKYLNKETRIPMKFIISFFIQYFKGELEKEMKN